MSRELTLRCDDVALSLDLEAGGRVRQLTIGDLEMLAHVDEASPFHWGSFVMAPWAGRIRRGRFAFDGRRYQLPINWDLHAIHGTVFDQAWSVAATTVDTAKLDCRFGDRWPWQGHVRQHIALHPSRVEFRIEVHAQDDPFPASAGWHPWFRRRLGRGGPVEFRMDAESMLLRDGDGIPTGERVPIPAPPWDDCFDRVSWPAILTWPNALRLEVTGDTRYAVVYTEPADALCVEPQTGPPDALTLDPVTAGPDRPLTARMTWEWRRGPSARP